MVAALALFCVGILLEPETAVLAFLVAFFFVGFSSTRSSPARFFFSFA